MAMAVHVYMLISCTIVMSTCTTCTCIHNHGLAPSFSSVLTCMIDNLVCMCILCTSYVLYIVYAYTYTYLAL